MKRAATALFLLLTATLTPQAMAQSIFLDPNNPLANFVQEGTEGFTPGGAILMTDANPNDHIAFFGATSVAAAGNVVDLTATFRIQSNDGPSGVDTGMRLVITDGAVTSFIAGCVTLGGMPGMAIAIGNNFAGAENWAGFVAVDWLNPVTVTIRRHANGDAEILEVNGAATLGSSLVPAFSLAAPVRVVPTVAFGLFSDPASTTIEMMAFSATAVTAIPEPETYAMLLVGLGLLGFAARCRKKFQRSTAAPTIKVGQ